MLLIGKTARSGRESDQMGEPLKTIVLGLLVLFGVWLVLALFEAMPHFTIVVGR